MLEKIGIFHLNKREEVIIRACAWSDYKLHRGVFR